jgi:hypothetical protein
LPFAALLFIFLVDRLGWQQISVLWHQDWVDLILDKGLGLRDYEKQDEILAIIFSVHSFFPCRLCSHCTAKHHYSLARVLWTPPLILFVTAV